MKLVCNLLTKVCLENHKTHIKLSKFASCVVLLQRVTLVFDKKCFRSCQLKALLLSIQKFLYLYYNVCKMY